VQGYNPPFTPSLGLEYQLFRSDLWRVVAMASSGFGYRVPTLNERFWAILGNPDIKPETSFNNEIGLSVKRTNSNQVLEGNITLFRNLVDNWTYWNPAKRYRVENLQSVLSKGLEVDLKHELKIDNYLLNNRFGYGLNDVSQDKEFGPYTANIVGKQLIYVPKHTINLSSGIQFEQLQLTVRQQFSSRRFITFDHSGSSLQPYYLLNLNLGYQYKKLNFALTCNNLTNTAYASLRRTLMPLRTFGLNVMAIL
jgi:vitamin B12 transporter